MKRVFIYIGAVLTVYILFRILTYQPLSQDDLIDGGFLDTLVIQNSVSESKFETQGLISGIEISANGYVSGSGILSIGYSDSASYREYEIDSGRFEIVHKSDWYAEYCYISFVPINTATGTIILNCNFVGDDDAD